MTEPWQLRVVGEYMALDEKITRLEEFISSLTFLSLPQVERMTLYDQVRHMRGYKAALAGRIGRFPNNLMASTVERPQP